MQHSDTRVVVLIGFMGAGKSSVGRAMAERLGWKFEDLDDRIERGERRKVAEIFRDTGESGFRHVEHAALKELLEELHGGGERGAKRIVALGGGALMQVRNARLIESAAIPTVFLDAASEELWRRCRQQAKRHRVQRPLLADLTSFCKLYEVRRPRYLKASIRQETGGKTVGQVAAEVIELLDLDRKKGRRGKQK